MWKVGDVEPVRVMGAEGYPYGFNVSTEDGKPIVSFAYAFPSPCRGSGNPSKVGSAECNFGASLRRLSGCSGRAAIIRDLRGRAMSRYDIVEIVRI